MDTLKTPRSRNTQQWKIDKDTFIPIKDMESEHIQKAIYFAENKIKFFKENQDRAKYNTELFEEIKQNLISEMKSRDIEPDTQDTKPELG